LNAAKDVSSHLPSTKCFVWVHPSGRDIRHEVSSAFPLGAGTQNYVCSQSGSGVAFVLMTPQATLFDTEKGSAFQRA
jgi:hypothetical protein